MTEHVRNREGKIENEREQERENQGERKWEKSRGERDFVFLVENKKNIDLRER